MDEVIEDIARVIELMDVLKSRYYFMRTQLNIEKHDSQRTYASKDLQSENQYALNDLQSYIMLDLYLLEYACTNGIYSLNMYVTSLKTNLLENERDPHFLKLLKDNVRSLVETNKKITDLSVDNYHSFYSYINAFMVNANVLNGINISNSLPPDNTNIKNKKNKLAKKISKINLMASIISFLVFNNITDYRTDDGRAALNMSLKYRTPRSLEYYTKIVR